MIGELDHTRAQLGYGKLVELSVECRTRFSKSCVSSMTPGEKTHDE